ncbi:MAG: ABC transporter substrate-binding protein [Spirochaetia bacterium]
MKNRGVFYTIIGVAVIFSLFVSCSNGTEQENGTSSEGESKKEQEQEVSERGEVVVASKIDTEGALLGSMIVHLLRSEGFTVEDKTQLGTTDVIRKALINGEVDLYPEYTGNGAFFFPDTEGDVWKDSQEGYETVKKLDLQENGLVWLKPAPANNTWAIAVREDLSEKEGLETLEDMAEFVRNGGSLKLAASEEFVTREDVLPAFEEAYDFHLSDDQLLTFSSGNTAQTEKAAAQETDGVNAAMAYGTDGQLAALGLRVLDDSKNVMPIYEPAPVVRKEVLEAYPSLEDILESVFSSLDRETLQELNSKIAVEGMAAEEVAEEYLTGLR